MDETWASRSAKPRRGWSADSLDAVRGQGPSSESKAAFASKDQTVEARVAAEPDVVVALHRVNPLVGFHGVVPGADQVSAGDPPSAAAALPTGTHFQVQHRDDPTSFPGRVHHRIVIQLLAVIGGEVAGHEVGVGLAVHQPATAVAVAFSLETQSQASTVEVDFRLHGLSADLAGEEVGGELLPELPGSHADQERQVMVVGTGQHAPIIDVEKLELDVVTSLRGREILCAVIRHERTSDSRRSRVRIDRCGRSRNT